MRVLLAREIDRLARDIRALPDRSQRKAVLLDRLRALRTKQLKSEIRAGRRKARA
jgi:hypothetical protein